MKKSLISWVLLFAIAVSLIGCGEEASDLPSQEVMATENASLDLLSAMIRRSVETKTPDDILSASMADFSLSLLQNSHVPGENTLLSPYSLYLTLAMTTNGARGETLAQTEALLGMSSSEVNPYALYLQNNGGPELSDANAIWIHEELSVEEAFLQSLKDYYETQVFTESFDHSTLEAMNNWIHEKTNGRIPQTLDRMDPNAVLYLINALTFDSSWETVYNTQDITDQTFSSPTGEITVEMMSSEESLYLDDGRGTGFLKDYEGGQYSFLALLPNEGISLEDYLSTLTGESLLRTVREAEAASVIATMPKVQLETSVEMKDVLMKMGMVDAFTLEADLSGINGQKDLYISRILHKTYLQIDEAGTQAGAVTLEEVTTKGVSLHQKFVFLNRPYIMGIYDKINGCFLFLGTIVNP